MNKLTKARDIKVSIEQPYKFDALKRNRTINYYKQAIEGLKEPYVLCLNSPWGTGKSKLIDMWMAGIENDKQVAIKFNAWDNDHEETPVISIVSTIRYQVLSKRRKLLEDTCKELIKNAASLVNQKLGIPIKTLVSIASKASSGNSEKLLSGLENILEDSPKIGQYINEIKKNLQSISEKIDQPSPILFFIDDLDRCKPTYAIDLLEAIKHIFNVPGYIFVLAMDQKQFGYTLERRYGANFDTANYLKRFIDFTFDLPKGNYYNYLKELFEYYSYFNLPFVKETAKDNFPFLTELSNFSTILGLSLRGINEVVCNIHLKAGEIFNICSMDPVAETIYAYFIVLKQANRIVYNVLLDSVVPPDNNFYDEIPGIKYVEIGDLDYARCERILRLYWLLKYYNCFNSQDRLVSLDKELYNNPDNEISKTMKGNILSDRGTFSKSQIKRVLDDAV